MQRTTSIRQLATITAKPVTLKTTPAHPAAYKPEGIDSLPQDGEPQATKPDAENLAADRSPITLTEPKSEAFQMSADVPVVGRANSKEANAPRADTNDVVSWNPEGTTTTPPSAEDLKVAKVAVALDKATVKTETKATKQALRLVAFMHSMQKFIASLEAKYNLPSSAMASLKAMFANAAAVCTERAEVSQQKLITANEQLAKHQDELANLSRLAAGQATPQASGKVPVPNKLQKVDHIPAKVWEPLDPKIEQLLSKDEVAVLEKASGLTDSVIAGGPSAPYDDELDAALDELQIEIDMQAASKRMDEASKLADNVLQSMSESLQDESLPTLNNWPTLPAASKPPSEMKYGELVAAAYKADPALVPHEQPKDLSQGPAEMRARLANAQAELESTRLAGEPAREQLRRNFGMPPEENVPRK